MVVIQGVLQHYWQAGKWAVNYDGTFADRLLEQITVLEQVTDHVVVLKVGNWHRSSVANDDVMCFKDLRSILRSSVKYDGGRHELF